MSQRTDLSAWLRSMGVARARAIAAATRGLDQAGEVVLGRARKYCPMDTGALRDSGTTTPAEVRGTKLTKTVGFNTDYAAAVHERLDVVISTKRNPQARTKYLETAIVETRDLVPQIIADEVRRAL